MDNTIIKKQCGGCKKRKIIQMKKIHIVLDEKIPVMTFCGKGAIKTAPLNVRVPFMKAIKESYLCKNCLAEYGRRKLNG